jgi:hypothetical protein
MRAETNSAAADIHFEVPWTLRAVSNEEKVTR